MNNPATVLPADPLADQPVQRVERWGTEFVLLGTAHVSRASVEAVRAMLEREAFDAVAIELCESRVHGMRDPGALGRMDLFQVIRQGKAGMVAASLALASFQRRLAERFGIEPGAEMKAAMTGADTRRLPLWLIDRDVGVTLKRAWRGVGLRERFAILGSLGASLFEADTVAEAEIEKLKQGDLLEDAFREFARDSAPLFHSLIEERDAYMAARLQQEARYAPAVRRVLVVVGAGHLRGLAERLAGNDDDPDATVAALQRIPPAARWPKWLAVGLVLAVFALIAFAFHRNTALGTAALRDWILFTGGFAALGAVLAGGHPLSVLAAFISAPLKPFRPGVPSGAFAGMAEVLARRPRVADFEALKQQLAHWTGWWRNRVARTLLVFMLVNLGTIAGEYLAGYHILKAVL